MRDVLARYPGAQRALFRRYHIGGCSSCGFQPTETLGDLCVRNKLSFDEVLAHLETSHEQDLKMVMSPTELKWHLEEEKAVRLLDIRTREEWEAAHIQGATLFSQPVLQEILAKWPREDLIVVYDHQGKQSPDAAAYFAGHGFTQVRYLQGGIDAWAQKIDPSLPRYRLES